MIGSPPVSRNLFEGVTVGKATNDERRVFVSRELIQRVLDKCPDWQWKKVVALARYGGLRCGSLCLSGPTSIGTSTASL
jgi:hypothetical protein